MRLELAERLRCPGPHAPTPMVVVARAKRGLELLSGFAGCPVCHLEAWFEDGDLHFPLEPPAEMAQRTTREVVRTISADGSLGAPMPLGWSPELDRTIALLGLAEPGGAVLLSGRYAALAPRLVELLDVGVVQFCMARAGGSEIAARVVGPTPRAPFTDGTFRAVAVDVGIDEALCIDLVRTVAVGGRMLGTTLNRVPAGLTELARDDLEWVAAREGTGAIVELKRRS